MRKIDLHVHTTASDGTLTPAEVVALACKKGLSAIAITDHDTTGGVDEAMSAGSALGVEVVPGVELSAHYLGHEIHILGYFIDIHSASIQAAFSALRSKRNSRNKKIIEKMRSDGIPISADVLRARNPASVLGRAHIASYLMELGIVKSVDEAFTQYLAEGKPYFIPRTYLSLEEAASVIRASGGIAVIAHPLLYRLDAHDLDRLFRDAISAGISGAEAQYSTYTPDGEALVRSLAAKYGFVCTGGSDFHGARKPDIDLGSGRGNLCVPYCVLDSLKKLITSKHQKYTAPSQPEQQPHAR